MYGHRLFCRIQVSNLRRNRTIHVGRILESDISIIPKFPRCVNIGFSCRIQVSDLRQNPARGRGLLFKPELAARSRQVFSLDTFFSSSSTFPTFDTAINQSSTVKISSSHSFCQTSIFVRSECQINIFTQLADVLSLYVNCTIHSSCNCFNILGRSCICSTGLTTTKAISSSRSSRQTGLRSFGNCGTALGSSQYNFRYFGACSVVLVSWQGDSGQDTDNCYNDHQFDQGETFLDCFHLINSSLKSVVNKNVCCKNRNVFGSLVL